MVLRLALDDFDGLKIDFGLAFAASIIIFCIVSIGMDDKQYITVGDGKGAVEKCEIPKGCDAKQWCTHLHTVLTDGLNVEGSAYRRRMELFTQITENPEQAIEAMLRAQMITAFERSATLFRMGMNNNRADTYLKYADKFQRRAIELAEVLGKLGRGADQKVIIEKINIDRGSQAIVGSAYGGRGE